MEIVRELKNRVLEGGDITAGEAYELAGRLDDARGLFGRLPVRLHGGSAGRCLIHAR